MRRLEILTKNGNTKVLIGEALGQLREYANSDKTVIVTDKNILRLHKDELAKTGFDLIEIGFGEQAKNLKTAEGLYKKFLELELERNSLVIGVGGGIVCDVVGFAASTYLRGIRFGFVPTTLLAQADASIGGKNGVNFEGYKNLIGTFNQPEFVLCDLEMLKTLPVNELKAGMAEIIKHAIIADTELFSYIEENLERILSLHRTALEKIVYDSIAIKSNIVSADEKEKNERRKLNFGHTIGHAIEKNTAIIHGEAVSIGMVAASKISVEKGILAEKEFQRIELLLEKIGLPTSLKELKLDKKKIVDAILKDKKRENEKIKFVLIEGIGRAVIEEIKIEELEKCLP